MSAEVFYDTPLPDRRSNNHPLYRQGRSERVYMELVILDIDPSNPSPPSPETPTFLRIISHFPITGLPTMRTTQGLTIQERGWRGGAGRMGGPPPKPPVTTSPWPRRGRADAAADARPKR